MDIPHVIHLVVPLEQNGTRLDKGLVELRGTSHEESPQWEIFAEVSRSRLQKLIENGNVLVDGKRAACSDKLQIGQQIEVTLPQPEALELIPEAMELDILFEDSDVIVVNKPAGLVVHPGAGHPTGTLVHGLLAHCSDLAGIGDRIRPGIVHRLDRFTSGAIIVAKNDKAHESLSRQFSERQIKKHYIAFIFGKPNPYRGVIDTQYGRHPSDRKRFTSKVSKGKRAVTSYAVEASGGGVSRVAIVLGTGRTHQIRVHFADRGHPVVGDVVYSGEGWARISESSLRKVAESLGRHALHASHLEFTHPRTESLIPITAALPPELVDLNSRLEEALES